MQTIIPVAGGGAIRMTTARYYTPSGRSIQALGIEPDITVEQEKLEKVVTGPGLHEADLKGALVNETVKQTTTTTTTTIIPKGKAPPPDTLDEDEGDDDADAGQPTKARQAISPRKKTSRSIISFHARSI